MEWNMRFGLVLDWAVKYATFEGNFFMFSWAKRDFESDEVHTS